MSSESDVRSRYLALALDARKIIDTLIVFVDREEREEDLDEALQKAIESLSSTGREHIFSPARNHLSFSEYYEQVRTVREVLTNEQIRTIVEELNLVRSNDTDLHKQKKAAYQAIKGLSAIESRALYHYRPQP